MNLLAAMNMYTALQSKGES